jgi:hypothetical protein
MATDKGCFLFKKKKLRTFTHANSDNQLCRIMAASSTQHMDGGGVETRGSLCQVAINVLHWLLLQSATNQHIHQADIAMADNNVAGFDLNNAPVNEV